MTEKERIQNCIEGILSWYPAVRRPLPWRGTPTPYEVWVSEIMLQQTRIETVIPYYTRFLAELPDVRALAEVSEDRLLKLWEGLGYYSRARNLQKAARRIMESGNGELPHTASDLRTLPGIGEYTAGAIASIAYGEPEPAVDGNVLRVLSRVLMCAEDVQLPATRRRMARLLSETYPSGKEAGLLTEGLMELGETVCVPNGEARCEGCPLSGACLARQNGTAERYPVRTPPRPRRVEERTILLLRSGDCWAVRRREKNGLLAGMWEFPNVEGRLSAIQAEEAVRTDGGDVLACTPCGEARHIFTHVEWRMTGWMLKLAEKSGKYIWKSAAEIRADCSIPSAFRHYLGKID